MNARSRVALLAGWWLLACHSERDPIAPPFGSLSSSAADNFIAFYSERSGGGDIYLYDANTSSLVSLPGLNTNVREVGPSLTPDGRFVAFQRTVGGPEDVFLYDRSTSSLVPLPGLNSGLDDARPRITPDGRFIAFTTARSGDAFWEDVLLYDRSTSSLVPLPGLNTNGPGGFHEGIGGISGDARFIAFRSNRSGVMDVFLYDRSASSLVPLPGLNDPAFSDDMPSPSSDARFVAFHSDRNGSFDIFLYDRSTSSLIPLPGLNDPATADVFPSLSADARFIAFSSNRNGLADVFVYDRTTSSLLSLPGLNDPSVEDNYPDIAFSGFAGPPANRPPTAVACAAVNVPPLPPPCLQTQTSVSGPIPRPVTLDGSQSSDPDGDALTYTWKVGTSVLGSSGNPTFDVFLGAGSHTITLTVSDGSHEVTATVQLLILKEVVILVHGIYDTPSTAFGTLGELLSDKFEVVDYDYSILTVREQQFFRLLFVCETGTPIQTIATDFALWLRRDDDPAKPGFQGLPAVFRSRSLNIVAKSMGGLVVGAYMAGLSDPGAGSYTAGDFNRVVTLGTPYYGAEAYTLRKLRDALCISASPGVQETQLKLGSDFVWQLDRKWEGRQPITPERLLNVAGVVTTTDFTGSTDESDGVVTVWSAVRPASRISFVPCRHVPAVSWVDNSQCELSFVSSPSDLVVGVITRWLNDGEVISPAAPPLPASEQGLVVIRAIADESGESLQFRPKVQLVAQNGKTVDCPFFVAVTKPSCNYNDETGALTMTRIPAGTYTLHLVNRPQGRVADDLVVTVTGGRPLVIPVRFRRTQIG